MATKEPKQEGVAVPTVVVSVIVVFVAGLLIGKFTMGSRQKSCKNKQCPAQIVRYRIYPRATNPSLGPQDAKVTIIEVSDLTCPKCGAMAKRLVALQKKFSKDVRLVFTGYPDKPNVQLGAVAVLAAKQQHKFWKFHDVLFSGSTRLGQADLIRYASQAGLNIAKFKQDLKDPRLNRLVTFDRRLTARFGIHKMPSVFINGRYVSGDVAMAQLEKVVKEELASADKMLASLKKQGRLRNGRAGVQVYRELLRDARTSLGSGPVKTNRRPKRPQEDSKAVYRIPIEGKPWKGAKNALVTIVESSDFQCPFSRRVEPTITQVMKAYKGKVKVVWHNNPLPFHRNAMIAAEAAWEAFKQKGNDGFWKFHAELYANQAKLRGDPKAFLKETAKKLGLNMAHFNKALEEHVHKHLLQAQGQVARTFAATGTPTFFINGRKLRGARPFQFFKSLIDEEAAKAEKTIKTGKSTLASYYATIMKTAATRVKYLPGSLPVRRRVVDPTVVYKIPIEGKPWKGAQNALITIVESSDFQCPFCMKVEPTIDQIMKAYQGKVKVVWHNNPLPFHRNSMIAAEAAWEAFKQKGNKGFWQFHHELYANQAKFGVGPRAFLEETAKKLGLNMARFNKALDTHSHRAELEQQRKLSNLLGARGTPGFFINGKLFVGARPFASFKRKIDEELANAKKMLSQAGGVAHLYAFLMKNAKSQAVYRSQGGPARMPLIRHHGPLHLRRVRPSSVIK